MLLTLFITFLGAFLTLIVMRPIAIRIGLVDKPNYRKRHQGAIPLLVGFHCLWEIYASTSCNGIKPGFLIYIYSVF